LCFPPFFQFDKLGDAKDIVKFCDELDDLEVEDVLFASRALQLHHKAMEF